MSQNRPQAPSTPPPPPPPPPASQPGALHPLGTAGVYLAAVLMLMQGVMTVFESVTSLRGDAVYGHFGIYAYRFSLTGWGWIQLVLGVFLIVASVALFARVPWARVVGVVLASLHLLANFLFLPYQPQWALTLIAVSLFVLWALLRGESGVARP
jgi:hypothetical protein